MLRIGYIPSLPSATYLNMSAKVEKILGSLTLEEKISLLAGKDFWETVPIAEKGVPAIKVCDHELSVHQLN